MADKRSLYVLAPTQKAPTPSAQIRTQLVQGRKDVSPLGSFNAEREKVSKGYSPAVHRPKITPTKPDRLSTTAEQENPRLQPPSQYTQPGQDKPLLSPTSIQPSSSLSLSENEDSSNSIHGNEPLRRNDLSPSKKEVPVIAKTATSPIKVVCHSPRRSHARDEEGREEEVRGYADEAARVTVPSVTKVTVRHNNGENRKPSHDGSISEDSLDNIKMIAGSPVDPNSSAVRVALDDNDKENGIIQRAYNADQYKSFIGDEHGHHHVGPLSAAMNQSNIRQQLFDFSVASVDSSTMDHSTMTNTSATDKKKKKKKPGRVIPSRYMDAKKPSSAKKPPSAKKNTSNRVSFQNTSKDELNVTAPHQNTSLKGSKIVTSTPAAGSTLMLPAGDMTAPTPILPPARVGVTAKGVSPRIRGTTPKQKEDMKRNDEKTTKPTIKMKAPLLPQKHIEHLTKQNLDEVGPGETSQHQLELEYARLIQWIFLESKLEGTTCQQEKAAQAQLYSMWMENEKLRREISELQQELDTKNKITEIDEQIQLQLPGLKSIGGNLSKQSGHYNQLSLALNTTCQYMPVNGIVLDNQEELLAALTESERLLGEIDSLTRHKSHKISTFSKEMGVLSKVTESEVQEQGRCQELLAAASTLSTQEQSLQAHVIQQCLPQPFNTTPSSDDHSL